MLGTLVCAALVAQTATPAQLIHDFTMEGIDGKPVPLRQYRGKVLVVVNVASRCGLTPQYEGLEALYRKYKDRGLVVLGFPANDFRNQEPGTNAEIRAFCTEKYDVTFPLFAKISVLGETRHPLYNWLVSQAANKEPVEWNFAKFVVDRKGQVRERFHPRIAPTAEAFVAAVEKLLEEKPG